MMKKTFAMILMAIVLSATAAFAGNGFPTTLAGIELGTEVKKYDHLCNMEEEIPLSDAPFLTEALIQPDALPGVRGGSLIYGSCKNKGKLVRIKLKFHDRKQKLFNKLLKRYKDAFGNPDTYAGDTFKNVIAWEWNFTNDKGRKIDLLLMWSRDKEVRPGVSIKMTDGSLYAEEYDCYKARDYKFSPGKGSQIKSLEEYVPQ